MKKLVLLFLIFSGSLNGQSLYELMSDSELKFGTRIIGDVGFSYDASLQICGVDTTCDLPVLKLYGNSGSARVHVDGEKIYQVYSSCNKLLFYDFSVSVGDTIREGVYEDYGVDSIYNVELLDGSTRLRYDLSKTIYNKASWIYGLGDLRLGFIYPISPVLGSRLICIRSGDNLLLENQTEYSCEESMCFDPRPLFDIIKEDSLISITNESICLDEYQYLWDFGDGNTSTEISPDHSYTEFGCYPISLGVLSDCSNDTTFRTTLVNHCSNNAWTNIGQFDFANPNFEIVTKDIQFVYGWYNLFKSIDNGESWIEIEIPPTILENSTRTIRDLKFYNEQQGIMICSNSFIGGQNQTTIFYTEDGGLMWRPAFDSYISPFEVTLGDDGLAWTNINDNDVLKSEDYGKTWTNNEVEAFGHRTRDYFHINDTLLFSTSYSLRDSSYFGISKDLGKKWEYDTLLYGIISMQFFDAQIAYLLADNGDMYKTVDGTKTWERMPLPFKISEFEFSSLNHAWFRSNTEIVYYTTDAFASYEITRCNTSTVSKITSVNDTLALGFVGGEISTNPSIYKYDRVQFSLSKVGTGNCEEEEIISSSSEIVHKNPISIYPNPASDILNIETDFDRFEVQVYNISGHQVLQVKNQKSFNIQNMPNGTYFVTITNEKAAKREHGKFIVNH